jgi:DHA1 family inner membrane transport protein
MNTHTSSQPGAALPLLALAIGAFGIGTTEFGPMGMLLTIAQGVNVSIPTAGLLVSAYAIGVTIGAPVMTLLLARWPRRKALIALMAIFTLGNVLSALSGLRQPDGGACHHQPDPRRLLWYRLGGGGQPGAAR